MKIETFEHKNVLPQGTFSNELGAVETKGKIVMSQYNGGCSIDRCNCSEGHWITIVQPRTKDGIVKGVKVVFDNANEMGKFLSERELICN